ncbi:MAG: DUF6591 domain-containing protein [Eubacteriales bacterium]
MKKTAAVLLSVLLAFALPACGASEKLQEKAAEKVIENALGGDVNVNIDGDKYSYEDKDGNRMEFGGTKWPTDEAAAFIPKFTGGDIVSTAFVANMYLIEIENVSQKDYESYAQTVKDAGFTEQAFTVEADGSYQYQALNSDGKYMVVLYEAEDQMLHITGAIEIE